MQPSEPLRVLLIAYLASFFADRLMPGSDQPAQGGLWPILLPLLVVWGLAVALLAVQRDLGAGSLFLALLAVLLFVVSRRWEALAIGLLLLLAAGWRPLRSRMSSRPDRAWLNPWSDPLTTSYQISRAVGDGGWSGRHRAGPDHPD
jgi:cell division protein FtsW (lipid II flippase)